MTVGMRIKKKREDCGISQTDLAKKIGVSKQSLYKYEMNIVTNIPSNVIEQIAVILHVSPCYLMGWEDKEQKKDDVPQILQYYHQLNDIGKHEATKRVEELTHLPRYVQEDTTYVNAAHADENETAEDRQAGDRIMMDDSEWE